MTETPRPLSLGATLEDLEALAKCPLLAGLSAQDLAALTERLDQVAIAKDSIVVREGDEGDYLYFVIEGRAHVSRRLIDLKTLGPGDHFGELAVVGVRRRCASRGCRARATAPSRSNTRRRRSISCSASSARSPRSSSA
jgi:CRP-like cAMP-binding protein